MPEMTPEERRAFLLEGTRTAKCATTRKDGRPHVMPVWFLLDGDDRVVFSTARTSVKGRAILRDGRVTLCVDLERPPYAFVTVEGTASTSENPDELLDWSIRLARRYMGDELAQRYGELNAGEGMMLVRVTPEHVVSESNVAKV